VVAAPKIVVAANPTAGRGSAGKLIGRADRILTELRLEHEIRVSTSAEDLEKIARAAAEQGAEVVAALGGDGSISAAANGVLGTHAALAALPAGTGDDFAKAIGARKFDAAVRLLANPQLRAVDVVRLSAGATVRHFVNIAGAGFDSEVNETANAMTLNLGSTGTYVAAVLKTLSRFSPARFVIVIDDRTIELDAMLAVVGSGISYGGGMKVLPDASLIDGVLDVCIVEALGKGAFLRAFPRVFRGSHTTHPKIQMHRGRRITMEANRRLLVYADGERIGPLPAIFDVLPAALPVVVGPNAKGIR
jgi:diacylglycerol kinase (ATP)